MSRTISNTAGIGLRHPHDEDFAREAPDAPLTASWIEVHSENFLCDGGRRLALL
ncbi:MAG: multinuclear nonheme iron-dependent oxidase, partial [Rhodospirillaceae bacterium]